MSPLSLGGITLSAPSHWTFVAFENMILAHTGAKLGTLQTSLAFRHRAPAPATHDQCLGVALEFVNIDPSALFDGQSSGHGKRLFGGASFGPRETPRRVFYTHDGIGLIVALYQARQPGARSEMAESGEILRGASYSQNKTEQAV